MKFTFTIYPRITPQIPPKLHTFCPVGDAHPIQLDNGNVGSLARLVHLLSCENQHTILFNTCRFFSTYTDSFQPIPILFNIYRFFPTHNDKTCILIIDP